MNTIWDNLGQQIRTWTNTAAEKAGSFTRAAANKAEELSKVGRLKMDIYQLQRERNRHYADLGSLAYRSLEQPTGPALPEIPGVEELRLRIAGLQAKIESREDELRQASDQEDAAKREATAKAKPATKTESSAKPKSTAGSNKTSPSNAAASRKKAPARAKKPVVKKKTVKRAGVEKN